MLVLTDIDMILRCRRQLKITRLCKQWTVCARCLTMTVHFTL